MKKMLSKVLSCRGTLVQRLGGGLWLPPLLLSLFILDLQISLTSTTPDSYNKSNLGLQEKFFFSELSKSVE